MGARRRSVRHRRRAGRLQHQPRMSARPRPRRSAARCARCAPISASRSTATPTASSIVDEKGRIVDGDQLMAVIAESWQRGRPPVQARHRRDGDVESRPRAVPQRDSGSRWRARRSATATCSSTCASTASISAASSRATSSCPTTPRPATGCVAAMQVLRRGQADEPAASAKSAICFEPLPQILKNVRFSHSAKALTSSEGRRACDRKRKAPARQSGG